MKLKLIGMRAVPDRYIVFAFHQYYPGGGLGDIQGSAETIEGALEIARKEFLECDYWEIMDRISGKMWTVEAE